MTDELYDELTKHIGETRTLLDQVNTDITRFLDILNIREVSDNDREFSPVYISCCRVMLGTELGEILKRFEKLVGYKKVKP